MATSSASILDAVYDPEDIREYIAGDGIDAADGRIGKLFDAIETLDALFAWVTGAKA